MPSRCAAAGRHALSLGKAGSAMLHRSTNGASRLPTCWAPLSLSPILRFCNRARGKGDFRESTRFPFTWPWVRSDSDRTLRARCHLSSHGSRWAVIVACSLGAVNCRGGIFIALVASLPWRVVALAASPPRWYTALPAAAKARRTRGAWLAGASCRANESGIRQRAPAIGATEEKKSPIIDIGTGCFGIATTCVQEGAETKTVCDVCFWSFTSKTYT